MKIVKGVKPRFDSNHIDSELSKNNECVQNIQPSPNILKIFKNSGYSTEEAVSDICDNSIDAGCKNIWIDVDSDPNDDKFYRMQIADDGIGMTPTILFGGLVVGAGEPELQDSVKNKDDLTITKYHNCLVVSDIIDGFIVIKRYIAVDKPIIISI